MYASVLLFTSGIGILIYKNIDSMGMSYIGFITFGYRFLFYFCFKTPLGLKQQTQFENPIFDYLILAAVLLSCILLAICNFNTLLVLNTDSYNLPTAIAFFCAYYFDNKSVLSIAITV
jgi:membrane protease YdiL (CAAX protease family)